MTIVRKIEEKSLDEILTEKISTQEDELSRYFYKIANPDELFKLGRNIVTEIEKGIKGFAFTSTGYKNSQQRTILGLCCFLDKNTDYKVGIVSDHLHQGIFQGFVEASTKKHHLFQEIVGVLNYKSFHHHFDFIHYDDLIAFYKNHNYAKSCDEELSSIFKKYDVIFWDIPEMEKIKMEPQFHYKISRFYESLTVVISQSVTSNKQVEQIKKFFGNYNINLSGILFDTEKVTKKNGKKKFLGIF